MVLLLSHYKQDKIIDRECVGTGWMGTQRWLVCMQITKRYRSSKFPHLPEKQQQEEEEVENGLMMMVV